MKSLITLFIKKKVLIIGIQAFLLFTFCKINAIAQGGQWVWMKGDSTYYSLGNYGTQGIPSPANNPRAIYEACQWTDLNGNFWLFGGGFGGSFFYSDLWKYDVATNMWTWISGPGTPDQYGVYGTKGISSPANHPGARGLAAGTWTDQNNNLWLFGGEGKDGVNGSFTNHLNDLWKYNIASNEWTWVSGDSVAGSFGSYGTQGISSPANTPSARIETNCTWVDNNGKLWLFGGVCMYPPFFSDSQDDLWMFDPVIGEWTWIKGSNTVLASPVYGTKGIPDSANTPGARCTYARWKDDSGNLWLFGGWNSMSQYTFNDLWKFDINLGMWTWIDGSTIHHDPGVYSSYCNNDSNDFPSARYENRSAWTDHCGNFWLYGGCHENIINSVLGDMWVYNPTTQIWKWVYGDTTLNRPAHYGTQGVSNPNDDPGARMGAVSYIDLTGNLWIFGGIENYGGSNTHNDLWKFNADTSCINIFCNNSSTPNVGFYSSDTTWCNKQSIDFFDISTNNPTTWQWYFQGASPDTSTLQNPAGIYYPAYGSFDVKLIACNSFGCDSLLMPAFVTEFQVPPQPVITASNDTFYCSAAFSYQWYDQNGPISGANQNYYVTQQPGTYFVIISDSIGCESSSNPVIINSISALQNNIAGPVIFPNPVKDFVTLYFINNSKTEVNITFTDLTGRILRETEKRNFPPGKNKIEIEIKDFAKGVYFILMQNQNQVSNLKMIVE